MAVTQGVEPLEQAAVVGRLGPWLIQSIETGALWRDRGRLCCASRGGAGTAMARIGCAGIAAGRDVGRFSAVLPYLVTVLAAETDGDLRRS